MTSIFDIVELTTETIEGFQLVKLHGADTHPNKVNTSIGAYRDENGQPWVLPAIHQAESELIADVKYNHEYVHILGIESFRSGAVSMLLGADNPVVKSGRAIGVQAVAGTGSLRLAAEFLSKHLKLNTFYYSDPSWPNYDLVFIDSGFTDCRTYPYWNAKTREVDFDAFINVLKAAPEKSVIILQGCAHNPTGMDPTKEQWKTIADVMEKGKLFPVFDVAYQGFASGDLDKDAWSVRYFVERGFELLVAQSFSKNMGLYNERVGNLTVVVKNPAVVPAIQSQMTWIIRKIYSNPPAHGAKIADKVLSTPHLTDEWKRNLKTMASRLKEMREKLKAELIRLGTPGSWDHVTQQIGMFSYTGLSGQQVEYLVNKHHIYLMKSGRISLCGLNDSNVEYVANAIHDAVTKFPCTQ